MGSIAQIVSGKLVSFENIMVWGAGGLGKLSMKKWLNKVSIQGVFDKNILGKDKNFPGLEIMYPAPENILEADCIIICTNAHMNVRLELERIGFKGEVFFIYELFLPEKGEKDLSELQKLSIDIAATKNDSWVLFLLKKPQVFVNITFRLCGWLQGYPLLTPFYWLCFLIHSIVCAVLSIQLPVGTQIGPGFIIAHPGTIVFTARARIGAFFTIYHCCTVGTNDTGQGPVIGNFVTLFTGSHILGSAKIGHNVRIGANSLVLGLSAPDGTVLIGSPARIINHKHKPSGEKI